MLFLINSPASTEIIPTLFMLKPEGFDLCLISNLTNNNLAKSFEAVYLEL